MAEAAQLLRLPPRQIKRLKANYRVRGPEALLHGNQGRSSWQGISAARMARVLELPRGRYAGFNQQYLPEMLAESEGVSLIAPRSAASCSKLGCAVRGPDAPSDGEAKFDISTLEVIDGRRPPRGGSAGSGMGRAAQG